MIYRKEHNIVTLTDTKDHNKTHYFVQYPIAIPSNIITSNTQLNILAFGPNTVTFLYVYPILLENGKLTRVHNIRRITLNFGYTNIKEVALLLVDFEKVLGMSNIQSIDQLYQYTYKVLYRGYAYNELSIDVLEVPIEKLLNNLYESKVVYNYLVNNGIQIPNNFYPSNASLLLVARGIGFSSPVSDYVSVTVDISSRYLENVIPVEEAQYYERYFRSRYIDLKTGNII